MAKKPAPVEAEIEIPDQSDFYKLPARFGAIPLDEAPLGYEVETKRRDTKVTKFEHAYPRIYLPFQEVQRVAFGHGKKFEPTELFPTGANRLFFGDNLHVMRQLPSKSIDLIYVDPPFFSGRNYNVIFGDKNEMRSFSDIWEGGMPGYLIWLNARLFEMKRLLKDAGSIYVHLDWHASHYVKVEMDKIFGADNFGNEIVWSYRTGGISKQWFPRKHDCLLLYFRNQATHFFKPLRGGEFRTQGMNYDEQGRPYKTTKKGRLYFNMEGPAITDVWEIPFLSTVSDERIGYPTQKPEALVEKVIEASSKEEDRKSVV